MATNVVFNGVTYSVPTTAGESGWASTLSSYLQALASGAATTSTVKQAIRTATSSPVTVVAATDYTVVTNLTVAGAVTVNLPAGVAKQVFVIVDGKGDAATNAITIDGNGAEEINGAATYVINDNNGGVMLQFDGTGWVVLAGFYGSDPMFTSLIVTTLGVTGTATVGTLAATNATVGGANVTTVSNTQSFTNKTFDADGTGNSITNIDNADIKTGAAIARNKLANGTASHVVINDGSGVMSSEATLAKVRGGTGADNSSVTFPASGTLVTEAGTQTLTNKTITSAELDTPLIDDYFDINEESAPGTPASGKVRVYAKSDAKLYKKDDNGVEQEIGAGGSGGGVNYIGNPLFADGTVTGWATYADAAGTTPVDGTGGSPNVTFTAQTGSLVRGTFSGRLTKDAANRQGQGASYDFTIDAADTGRPVNIAFDFLAGGSYAANDVGVYIYDVTNATLITPAAINVAAGKGTFRAFFVATTSTSYRLILHVASTNASAWTLDTDNFQVGPQQQLSGAAVTDMQSYTPTFAGFGTVAGPELLWGRSGDRLFVEGRFTSGTNTGATVSFTLPSGLTPSDGEARQIGRWWRNSSTANANKGGPLITLGGNLVFFGIDDRTETVSPFTQLSSIALNGETISVHLNVAPIANWSSNTTMAERAVETYSADDGSGDVFGPNGALVPNVAFGAGGTNRDFVFQNSRNATDLFVMEVNNQGLGWIPAFGVYPYSVGNNAGATNEYGMRGYWISATTFRVRFGNQGTIPVLSTANNGESAWATEFAAGTRFRVRQVQGGAVVGFPVGVQNLWNAVPTVVTIDGFNPSDLIGTATNATARTIQDAGTGNITVSAISAGTVTFTFNEAGKYKVDVNNRHSHAAAYSLSAVNCIFGGTANNIVLGNLEAAQEPANDRNGNGAAICYSVASAGQTLTIQTRFELIGSGVVGNHLAQAMVVIQRIA